MLVVRQVWVQQMLRVIHSCRVLHNKQLQALGSCNIVATPQSPGTWQRNSSSSGGG